MLAERHLGVFEQVFVVLAMHECAGRAGGWAKGRCTRCERLLAMITTHGRPDNAGVLSSSLAREQLRFARRDV
jgi:hypothetical protein